MNVYLECIYNKTEGTPPYAIVGPKKNNKTKAYQTCPFIPLNPKFEHQISHVTLPCDVI